MSSCSSSDLRAITKDLKRYANSGSEAALTRLQNHFRAITQAGTVVMGDKIDVKMVHACVIQLLESLFSGTHTHAVWECLTFLCDDTSYTRGRVTLMELSQYSHQLYDRLLLHMASILAGGTDSEELMDCLVFLVQFTSTEYNLLAMGAHYTLRKAFWSFMDGPFFQVNESTQSMAMVVAVVFVWIAQDRAVDHIWASFKEGSLPIYVRAVLHINKDSRGPEAVSEGGCGSWGFLWRVFQTALTIRPEKYPEDFDPSIYRLNRNDLSRLTLVIYDFFNLELGTEATFLVFRLAVMVNEYLLTCNGLDSARDFLLYQPPRVESATTKPLVVLMRDAAHRSQSPLAEHGWAQTLTTVRECGAAWVGEVTEALDVAAVPTAPARTDKDRHCAYPSCKVTGEGLVAAMQKCGRCKSVYYCSVEHQKHHWPEHKKCCR